MILSGTLPNNVVFRIIGYISNMKNLTRFSSLIFTILLSSLFSFGQIQTFEFNAVKMNTTYNIPWYGELANNHYWSETEFIKVFTETYFGETKTQFKEIKRSTDDLGFTHVRLQHYIDDVLVNHGILNLHIKDDVVESFNGELYLPVNRSLNTLDYTAVKAAFLAQFQNYQSWTILDEDKNMQGIYCPNTNRTALEYCFRFRLQSPDLKRDDFIFFNPSTTSLTRIEPQLIHSDSVGTAKTFYRGTKPVTTDFVGTNSFRMKQNGKPINTYDSRLGNYVTDADNNWKTTGKEIAGDVHYALDLLHTYMDTTFGWDSYANNGDSITSVLNFGGSGNAFWNLSGNFATFLVAKTTSVNPCAAIDVIGHEFGHGIADENAGLVYSGESCMLHESFADISGTALEHYEDTSKSNWLLGEEVWVSRGGIRNMKTPKAMRHPDTYKGQYWAGGCHNNGEVQNHWFYMMVEGDTGTNDNRVQYDIKGLGRDSATQIMFRAMFYYVTPNTQFSDMAAFTLKATKDLYGTCGKELQMVWDAWEAAGIVDTTVKLTNFDHGIVAPKLRCTQVPATQKFSSIGDPSREVLWTYGSGDTTSSFSFEHKFTDYGSLNVMLSTSVCNKVFRDTLNIKINAQPDAQFTPSQIEFCKGFNDTLIGKNTTTNPDKNQTLLHKWVVEPYDIESTTTDLTLPLKDLKYYFSIELTSYYATGCESKKKVFISPVEVSTASFTTKSVCQETDIIIHNNSDTTRKVKFDWKVSGSKTADHLTSSDYEPVFNFSKVQDVIIQLTATDVNTNCKSSISDTIEIFKNPEPTFSYSNTCYDDTVRFVNTTSHPTSITWFKWDFGFFRPFNKDTTFHIATKAEPIIAGLEVRDDNGCKIIAFDTIQIEETIADFDFDNFCLNAATPFVNKSKGTGLSYLWNFGNGTTSLDTNGTSDYKTAGDYNVSLTALSANCTTTKMVTVAVLESPKASYNATGICIGDGTQFSDQSDIGILATTHRWLFGDGDTSNQINPNHYYDNVLTTSYFTSLILTNSLGCQDRINKTITVHELPHCGFDYSYGWPSHDVIFSADSTAYSSYKWYFGDGDSTSDINPTHNFNTEDTFSVTLIVTNSAGCTCTETTQVKGGNVSIKDFNIENITLFPNPNKGTFAIKSDLIGSIHIQMVDVYGRMVFDDTKTSNGLIHINTMIETAGAYMILIQHDGKSYTIPVLVE
jgi:Zn-dependent metalloprotease/PKD repeat protein